MVNSSEAIDQSIYVLSGVGDIGFQCLQLCAHLRHTREAVASHGQSKPAILFLAVWKAPIMAAGTVVSDTCSVEVFNNNMNQEFPLEPF